MTWERVIALAILVAGGVLMRTLGGDAQLAGVLIGAAGGSMVPFARKGVDGN